MKRIILALMLVVSMVAVSSAIDQGRVELGGSAGFSMYNNSDAKLTVTDFSLMPDASYFVMKNLSVGASIMFSMSSASIDGKDAGSSTSFGIGPKARYYFELSNPNMLPFVGVGFMYASTTNTPPTGSDTKFSQTQIPIGGGLRIMLNNDYALDAGLSFSINSSTVGDADAVSSTVFGINVGFSGFLK